MTPPAAPPRSWSRAVADIKDGFAERQLWSHLGWQDIKQRYRRSVIGPLWITIGTGMLSLGLGLIYSQLFGTPVSTFLPYVTTGFVIWFFMLGCINEGAESFIANEGLIKHLPAPLTVYVLRTVWRQALFFAHNLIVYVVVLAIYFTTLDGPYKLTNSDKAITHPGLSWTMIFAIPALALIVLNAVWVAMLFGIISTRFRDVPPVLASFIQLVFYITPIVWQTDLLVERTGNGKEAVQHVARFNPLYHFIEIARAPMLGMQQSWTHWVVVLAFTVIGWGLALLALRNYRARVSYWV